jgi:hypothetical protein
VKSRTLIFCATSLLMFGCASPPPSTTATKSYTLPSSGNGAPRLQIDLPSSFSMRRHEGPDFDVFYFSDASTKNSLGLYVGDHPSLHSSKAGVASVQHQQGRVGHVSVEWLRWSSDGRHWSETLVHDFFGQSTPREYAGLVLHIFTGAPTAQDVVRMEAAATTLRLERAR